MAIAFLKGTLSRDPIFKIGEKAPFAACTLKEVYTDRNGDEQFGGYHDVIAFGDQAQEIGAMSEGDSLEVQASIRYRPDKRYVSTRDSEKNPFMVQYVVQKIVSRSGGEDDPFSDA